MELKSESWINPKLFLQQSLIFYEILVLILLVKDTLKQKAIFFSYMTCIFVVNSVETLKVF